MYTILAADDAKDTLMLLEFDLQAEGYQVLKAEDGESALAAINNNNVDILLLDLYMPGMSGIETLKQLKATPEQANIPVIMLSASDDEDKIVEALELGAHDYVTKPYIAKVLLARIRNAIRLREKTLTLENLAKTDFLTKLNNKGSFEQLSLKAINQGSRAMNNMAVAMIDIDHFKAVNDNYGHEAGDIVLKQFAQLLAQTFRDYDIVGRVGGEEFAVCMPEVNQHDAVNACERFRKAVEQTPMELGNEQIFVTTSIGVACAQHIEVGYDFNQMMQAADKFLYDAKQLSRNVTLSHPPEGQEEIVQQTPAQTTTVNENHEKGFVGIDYQVGLSNVLGDDDLFKEILKMFFDDHHQDGVKIQQAIDTDDQASMKHLVHTLKGVACSVGAMQLFERAKQLDFAVNDGDKESYQGLFDNVSFELNRVITGIKTELNIV
ncbi:diguanylate cyclase [Thalassotalea euphylliae]|uniref:diguanylate cyclase n=1 Tax=Thalassotalea euphylliae TaxID=1655234 RepID=A0A3E0TZG2_9GAMM|nr:diguanylate cyclase [Thalassotalea euphylliae]REL29763.1 diguanylate cyclase [Thalassotalea euphylliae]